MRIDNYKYNEQTFEKEAYQLLQKRDIADNNLKRQERLLKKDVRNISLDYYKAYLNYMHQSNEHMASFLAYLKHEYEMSRRTTILFFNDEEMLNALNNNIEKLKKSFKFYCELYDNLKQIEFELKETIDSFEANKFKEDAINLLTIHSVLEKLSTQDLIVQNTAELYRDRIAFPLIEESLKTRNKGLKFETYAERAKKIVEESEPMA